MAKTHSKQRQRHFRGIFFEKKKNNIGLNAPLLAFCQALNP